MVDKTDMSILLDEFLEDATGHLDAVESALLEIEKNNSSGLVDVARITQILGNLHTVKGNSGMMGLSSIQQLVHKLEAVFKQVLEGTVGLSQAFFETLYTGLNNIREALAKLVDSPSYQPDFSDVLMLIECLASGAMEADGRIAPAERKEDTGYITKKANTLKVNFEKLDDLLNLVGELVIHRTSLLALEARIREVDDKPLLEQYVKVRLK